jgi:type IV pilus assembly protein PilM
LAVPFLSSFKSNPSVVGLDIGSSSVKAVELKPVGEGYELTRLGRASLPSEAIVQGAFLNTGAIVDAIREAVDTAGIRSKSVATAISGHSVIVKKITVQEMSREALEESIKWEAEQYIPFDVNEVNLDFQILDTARAEGQMDVLLVAAKKDLLDDYCQVISEAGFQAQVVDVAGFAVENAWEANAASDGDEVVAIANIGSQTSNINVVARGVPVFTRDVALGGNLYTEEIQKTLSISFEEAEKIKIGEADVRSQDVVPKEVEEAMRQVTSQIVAEIARSLEFYAATAEDGGIGRIVLSGGSAQVSGLAAAFQDRMDVPVEVMSAVERIPVADAVDPKLLEDLGPALAVGVGLAMRRLDEE